MLIVRDASFGAGRLDDLQGRLGISRNVFQGRLCHLVRAGVLEMVPYWEHPPRYDDRLTAKGRDLWPVLATMLQWGDRHARGAAQVGPGAREPSPALTHGGRPSSPESRLP